MATVNTQHPDYIKMLPRWQKCEDAAEGQQAIHAKGTTYLPKLKDQTSEDYEAMKCRATFFNATWRTIAGLNGMLFRKPPVVDVPKSIEPMMQDVTLEGHDIESFAQDISIEALKVGRVAVLVDYPKDDTEGLTIAEAERRNMRPTMHKIEADDLINWKTEIIDNKPAITLVVIKESYQEAVNEFKIVEEDQYLVLDLAEGVYRQRVFRINDKDEDVLMSEYYPMKNGALMLEIPLIIFGVDDIGPDVDSPPLEDLIDINIAHYRVTADYEHGCHFTGLPTPVISGYQKQDENDNLYIGSTKAWVFTDPAASANYLEFTGSGLSALVENLNRKEQQMAILGARMLSADRKGVEAADTAAIHRSGENSVLASIASILSAGLSQALSIFSDWAGAGPDASIEINTDFIDYNMTAQEMGAIQGAWQSGMVSHQSAFNRLKQYGFYADNVTFEDEQAQIDNGVII